MTESEKKEGDVLAVVVPCYNEETVLHETTRRLTELLDRLRAQGDVDAITMTATTHNMSILLLE